MLVFFPIVSLHEKLTVSGTLTAHNQIFHNSGLSLGTDNVSITTDGKQLETVCVCNKYKYVPCALLQHTLSFYICLNLVC